MGVVVSLQPFYLASAQAGSKRLTSPSFSFLPKISSSFHYLPALFPGFYELSVPSAGGRRLLSRGRGRNPEPVNPGSLKRELSVSWFFSTRSGSRAIMEANWLMISCLVWLLQPWFDRKAGTL